MAVGPILISLFFSPTWWQWPLLFLPGAGIYLTLVILTYKETPPNNVRARKMFGWCVGFVETGPAFLVVPFERFIPPIMEGTEDGATLHTGLVGIQLYSVEKPKELADDKHSCVKSYKIDSVELKNDTGNPEDVRVVDVDASIWFRVANFATNIQERWDAYYDAAFVGGSGFMTRVKLLAESQLRSVFGMVKKDESTKLLDASIIDDSRFKVKTDNTKSALKDIGVGVETNEGFVIAALGFPAPIQKATQDKIRDGILGEGESDRYEKGLGKIQDAMAAKGYSPDQATRAYLGKEFIENLPEDTTLFMDGMLGGAGQSSPGSRSRMPKPVIPMGKKKDTEKQKTSDPSDKLKKEDWNDKTPKSSSPESTKDAKS